MAARNPKNAWLYNRLSSLKTAFPWGETADLIETCLLYTSDAADE